MNFKVLKNNKGITLMELVIVLAIISIIGAILAPNFVNTTDRARLRSDIQSTMVIQSSLDLYRIETGNNINGDMDRILKDLLISGYLASNNETIKPQTDKAFWIIENNLVKLDVSQTSLSEEIINNLNDNEKLYITNNSKVN